MSEQLPISIEISSELIGHLKNIRSISNKLEAQLNFQTLAANWYGNEEDILTINLYLDSINDFIEAKNLIDVIQCKTLSDDVFSTKDTLTNTLDCHIEITPTELQLLIQQPKLLSGYLSMKLTKVLNLLAKSLGLMQV